MRRSSRTGLARKRCDQWFRNRDSSQHLCRSGGQRGIVAMVASASVWVIVPAAVIDHSPMGTRCVVEPKPALKAFDVGITPCSESGWKSR